MVHHFIQIRHDRKYFPRTNTLAYYEKTFILKKKYIKIIPGDVDADVGWVLPQAGHHNLLSML